MRTRVLFAIIIISLITVSHIAYCQGIKLGNKEPKPLNQADVTVETTISGDRRLMIRTLGMFSEHIEPSGRASL